MTGIKNSQKGIFAMCNDHGTRPEGHKWLLRTILCRVPRHGNGRGAIFCRVPSPGHTTNIPSLPCATPLRHMTKNWSHPMAVMPLFFLLWAGASTRQNICHVPNKRPTTNSLFVGCYLPWVLCHVSHTANKLPWVNRLLLCAFGTRQIRSVPQWWLNYYMVYKLIQHGHYTLSI